MPLVLVGGICRLATSQVMAHLHTVAWCMGLVMRREISIRGQIGVPGEMLIL